MPERRLREALESLRIEPRQRPDPPPPRITPRRALRGPVLCLGALGAVALGAWMAGGRPHDRAAAGRSARFPHAAREAAAATVADPRRTAEAPAADRDAPQDVAPAEPVVVFSASGRLASEHVVEVATKVSGQLVEVPAEEGMIVQAGQTLARVDDFEYRAQCDLRAALLREAEADLARARYEHERTRRLRAAGLAADAEWNHVDTALAAAEARVAAARAALEVARRQLADCRIVAPIDGLLLAVHVDAGDFVALEGGRGGTAPAVVATLADPRRMRVELDVAEQDVTRLAVGAPCTLVPEAARERRYDGRIARIGPAGNYGKGTVRVVVSIERPDEHLRVGGAARVDFLGGPTD